MPSILSKDPLDVCLNYFDFENFDIEGSIQEVNAMLDSAPLMTTSKWSPKFEALPLLATSTMKTSLQTPPTLELKPLDAGIIYPISDSEWVSLTQVVPTKSELTVVENKKVDLVHIIIPSHKIGEGEKGLENNNRLIDGFVHNFDIDKVVRKPFDDVSIDFIIPDFYSIMDQTILFKCFNQFYLFSNDFCGGCFRQENNKCWLGDYPYWVRFGSIEFMPIDVFVGAMQVYEMIEEDNIRELFVGISNPFSHYF